jgi:hypothetical protein
MIKTILEDAVKKIQSEKNVAINQAIAKNKTEVVNPKFVELEKAKNESIAKINSETSKKIAEITTECSKSKTEFETEQVAEITASVGASYDTQIATLQSQIDKINASTGTEGSN